MEVLMEAEEGQGGEGEGGIDCAALAGGRRRRLAEQMGGICDRPDHPLFGDIPSRAEFPSTFSSAEYYMKCLRSEISQNVIEQLKLPLGCLDQANSHEITDIKEIDFPYYMIDVELNTAGGFRNHLRRPFRRGDMIILSEAPGKSHGISLAMVAEDEDLHFHTSFKVRIMRKDDVATSLHYKCATILELNIQSDVDSCLSAHADIHNKSQCIVNSIIQLPDVVTDQCPNRNNSFDTSRFENDLDEYQIEAMESILIKGPKDSRKTKLISAILASIGHTLRCVVYAPSASDVVGILNEIKHLNMSQDQYKQFCEKAIVFERACDLGADFRHMSVESRIDSTRKFLGTPGWKYFINWAVQVLQDYKQLYKAFTKARKASFLDIFKDEFMKASKHLKNCIQYLHTRVQDSTVEDNIMKLMSSLKEMEELLGHADLDNRCLRDVLSKENFNASSGNYAIAEKEWQQDTVSTSLFERLTYLGFKEHLLLEQHKRKSLSWHNGRKAPEQPNVCE
uniref:DNA2/NAM7 helicase helicase domain-containing protein n=1 Tax=Oryza punctata TaxID=4537 RepID=A0A0E0MJA2_ORYPU